MGKKLSKKEEKELDDVLFFIRKTRSDLVKTNIGKKLKIKTKDKI